MKRIPFLFLTTILCICSCHSTGEKKIFKYSELQDSLECFIKQARPIGFPENTPTLYFALFYKDPTTKDTICLFFNGLSPFNPHSDQKVIGGGEVKGHICEIIYVGFDSLPNILNEDNLNLGSADYEKFGYREELFQKSEYDDWIYRSGWYLWHEKRNYRINRPNPLERIN